MPSAEQLKSLLREFNLMGYADSTAIYLDNGKNGKVINKVKNDFKYEDEFYGGEPYSGNETIWYKGKDVFRCVYWGKVVEGIKFGDVYDFLRRSLAKGPDNSLIHRGPTEYSEDDFKYTNTCEGNIEEFKLTERIFIKDKEVYTAYFFGGRVNVQDE